tara:strand:+ start:99 stop:212 length:114 start_codon:yes stop_codon:yes gene_type:complete
MLQASTMREEWRLYEEQLDIAGYLTLNMRSSSIELAT